MKQSYKKFAYKNFPEDCFASLAMTKIYSVDAM